VSSANGWRSSPRRGDQRLHSDKTFDTPAKAHDRCDLQVVVLSRANCDGRGLTARAECVLYLPRVSPRALAIRRQVVHDSFVARPRELFACLPFVAS
jgi:hypothetical protein